MRHLVYTSVNLDYLDRAILLGKSIKEQSPNAYFVIVLVEPRITLKEEDMNFLEESNLRKFVDRFLFLEDLPITLRQSISNLNVIEACTAVKAHAAVSFLQDKTNKFVTYLDPDIYVYQKIEIIDEIYQMENDTHVLLVPHLNNPPLRESSIINNEIHGSLKHGVFNLGFISFRNSHQSLIIADWWSQRLLKYCRIDYESGIFTDQKWFDLAIAYFSGIKVIRDSGWDLATWNLDERNLKNVEDFHYMNDGTSLFFYHFSKFPSKVFDDVLKNVAYSKQLEDFYSRYKKSLSKIQEPIDFSLTRLQNKRIELEKNRKSTKSVKKTLQLVNSRRRFRFVRYIAKKLRLFEKIGALIIRKTFQSDTEFNYSLEISKKYKFNIVVIGHYGDGGTQEYIQNQILEFKSKSWALITPQINGTFLIWSNLFPFKYQITHLQILKNIILSSDEVYLHHFLGWENHRDIFLQHAKVSIFLHDRYFLTMKPFADSLDIFKTDLSIPGVNQQLNRYLREDYNEESWLKQNYELFKNANNIYAPSTFLINSYKEKFKNCKIQKIDWENSSITNSYKSYDSPKLENRNKTEIVVLGIPNFHKGSEVVLEVAKLCLEKSFPIKFRIFGEMENQYKTAFSKLSNVALVETIPRSRILYYLSQSNHVLGWIPSVTGESHCFAFSDFVATKTPFITSDSGALSERSNPIYNHITYNRNSSAKEIFNLIIHNV